MIVAAICVVFLMLNTDTVLVKHSTENYQLLWSDEFNKNGMVDTSVWHFEKGFVRNNELQWYQPENVWCENGELEGR
jgi:hypothetical protein